MLTLSLLRHAKSSWAEPGLDDFDRPLNERGEAGAARMGAFMAERGIVPELILCSPAARTKATLEIVLAEFEAAPKARFEKELYLASLTTLRKRVQKGAKDVRHLMLLGHNPGLHALALDLAGEGERADLARLSAKLPTAGLVVLELDVDDWADVAPRSGRLTLFAAPKTLGA